MFFPFPSRARDADGSKPSSPPFPTTPTTPQQPNSIFIPYPPGLNASTIYSSRFYGFRPTPPAPFDCGVDCANATHYLWGLSTVVVDWPKLRDSSLLVSLPSEGYSYQLLRPDTNSTTTAAAAAATAAAHGVVRSDAAAATPTADGPDAELVERRRRRAPIEYVLAGQDEHLDDAMAVSVDVLGTPWTLELAPASGSWAPAWRAPLVAAVALASAGTGLLVLSTLKAQHQHYALLRRMLPDKVIRRLRNAALFYAEQQRRRRRRARRRALRLGLAGGGGHGTGSSALSRRLWALWYRFCGLVDPSMALDADVSVHSKYGGGVNGGDGGGPGGGGGGNTPGANPTTTSSSTAPLPPAYVESVSSATVLFSDIVSYTSLAAAMRPEAIVAMLNEVFSAYEAICLEERVHKVETVGDGFMAVAGGQFLGDDDATAAGGGGGVGGEGGGGQGGGGKSGRGLLASLLPGRRRRAAAQQPCGAVEAAERAAALALRMVQATAGLSLQARISIRVGLHSGPVVAAVVGRAVPRLSFFGDTVNTASRMETASLPGFVHLSEATAQLLAQSPRGRWDMQPRGEIQVKGKGVMRTFFLHGYDPGPERPLALMAGGEDDDDDEDGGLRGRRRRALSRTSSSRDLEAARAGSQELEEGDDKAAAVGAAAATATAPPPSRRPRRLGWLSRGGAQAGSGGNNGNGPRPAAMHPPMGVGPLQGLPIPPAPPPGAAQGSMPSFTSTEPPPFLQQLQQQQQQHAPPPSAPGSSSSPGAAATAAAAAHATAPSFSRPASVALDDSQSRPPSGLWRGLSGGSSVMRAGGVAQSSFTSGVGGVSASADLRWGAASGRSLPPRRREPPSREASLRSMRVSSLHLDTRERYGAILDIAARHPNTPTEVARGGSGSGGGAGATGAAAAGAAAVAAAAVAAGTAAAVPPGRAPSSGTGVDSIVEGDDEDGGTGGAGDLTTGSTMRTQHGSATGSSSSGGGGGGAAAAAAPTTAAIPPPSSPPLFPGDAADGVIYYGASADGGAVLPPPSSPLSQPSMGGGGGAGGGAGARW
jgi:class 3 adenylate cyclase